MTLPDEAGSAKIEWKHHITADSVTITSRGKNAHNATYDPETQIVTWDAKGDGTAAYRYVTVIIELDCTIGEMHYHDSGYKIEFR